MANMNARMAVAFFSLFLFVAGPSAVKSSPSMQSTANPYPNSTDGLQQLATDMLSAQQKGGDTLAPFLQALVLPRSQEWFVNVFGDANGQQYAAFYDAWGDMRNSQLTGDLVRALAAKMVPATAYRFDQAGDSGTTDKDNRILNFRRRPEPLYAVEFKSASGETMRWEYFVFVDGSFRYLGPLPEPHAAVNPSAQPTASAPAGPAPSAEMPKRVRIAGDVIQAQLVHVVQPIYPPEALANRLEGSVVLHAILAPDGSVQSMDVQSGNSVFVNAAETAVKQWRYQPVLLNGSPVAVDTTITVNFQLPASAATELNAPTSSAPPAPSFPDSTGGLTKMMKQMLALAEQKDNSALVSYYQALTLPDANTWFPSNFGDRQGTEFAQRYGSIAAQLNSFFVDTLASQGDLKSYDVEVRRFKEACDSQANPLEYPTLAAREQPVPFYEVRFVKDTGFRWLFPFVYVNGAFRYLGYLQPTMPKNQLISAGGQIQEPKLIHQTQPIYPMGFNLYSNSGMVKLWGVIGTDGSVRDLHVLEGTCAYVKATVDAIKKWRYTPMLVDGKPQQVYYQFQYSYAPGQ
jgi:TonB family protein